jgi:hypothetical protein
MHHHVRKILIVFSITLNAFVVLLLVFSITRKTAFFSFFNPETDASPYLHGAFIVSVPAQGADLVFGPAEFSLKIGDEAALQFSLFRGRQSNLAMEPLYDRSIISIERSGFGLIIRGISSGEALLQLFSPDGFNDIARITVYE